MKNRNCRPAWLCVFLICKPVHQTAGQASGARAKTVPLCGDFSDCRKLCGFDYKRNQRKGN